jgi:rhamnopyranosyl-N-acetylglucosaminyl-diphospho-decaprenol beta-1,3/1,4-galactofuranosyltransferase
VTRVQAVVVTHNRKRMLLECLDALAAQTRPPAGVTVVDNASTDRTLEALEESGIGARLAVDYVRLRRNGGGAEGFHYGVRAALRTDPDWLWLMDDDCEPQPTALADLLASPLAADPRAAMLTPLVTTTRGEVLPLNRGWLRPRWFKAPLVGLSPEHWERSEVEIDFSSLVGPLVRASAAAGTDPPRRDFFIWFDDLEWTARLRRAGRLWLVPGSRMIHKDERPLPDISSRALVRDLVRGHEFPSLWKRMYGVRNFIWCGRRDGWFTPARAASYTSVAALRALLSARPRLRALRLTLLYARDGWRGRFLNLAPERWPDLASNPEPLAYLAANALRYDVEVDSPAQRLSGHVAPRR